MQTYLVEKVALEERATDCFCPQMVELCRAVVEVEAPAVVSDTAAMSNN